jgi:hypothetical protein
MEKAGRALGAALMAVGALVVAAAPASAGQGAKSKIVIKQLSQGGASGKVSSKRASCERKRKVSLFLYDGFVTDKVGITHTNSKGKWRIEKNLDPGRYFAKVDSAKGCRYDNSKTKELG